MEKFESFKVAELKDKLQEVGLDTKGRKKELIERLRSYLETQEGGKATLDGEEKEALRGKKAEEDANVAAEQHHHDSRSRKVDATVVNKNGIDAMMASNADDNTDKKRGTKGKGGGRSKRMKTSASEEEQDDFPWVPLVGTGFSLDGVQRVYMSLLGGGKSFPKASDVSNLEMNGYFEEYLSRGRECLESVEFLVSCMLMLNETCKHSSSPWRVFENNDQGIQFSELFDAVVMKLQQGSFTIIESLVCVSFLSHAFQSLEDKKIRKSVMGLVGLGIWYHISEGRLKIEMHRNPAIAKRWKSLAKKVLKDVHGEAEKDKILQIPKYSFVSWFLDHVVSIASEHQYEGSSLHYLKVCLQFLVEILSQLPTRRFVHALVDDKKFLDKLRLVMEKQGFKEERLENLFHMLELVIEFPVDSLTGEPLRDSDLEAAFYEKVQRFQRLLFFHWEKLRDFSFAPGSKLSGDGFAEKLIKRLDTDELELLFCKQARLLTEEDMHTYGPDLVKMLLAREYKRPSGIKKIIENLPLYPTEDLLVDEVRIPGDRVVQSVVEEPLALPRLSLQFLSLADYIERNFLLYRVEAAYEIREHLYDVISRMNPEIDLNDRIKFTGWARMAQEVESFAVTEVRHPKVGTSYPSKVVADVIIDTETMRKDNKREWDELRQHDILLLVGIGGGMSESMGAGTCELLRSTVSKVRGCEIVNIQDENGNQLGEYSETPIEKVGQKRVLTVELDPIQYQRDAEKNIHEEIYSSFSMVVRRSPKESNFKAVLQDMRDVLSACENSPEALVPAWFSDVMLGYGDPNSCHFSSMAEECTYKVDFQDTFVDKSHIKECFKGQNIEFVGNCDSPPYMLTFSSAESLNFISGMESEDAKAKIVVESHKKAKLFEQRHMPHNTVRFTAVQVGAITSGLQPGLTSIVGPPGTGKTDTAVQILHLLYHNYPKQRTLIITHSNQALNDIFQKLAGRDVEPLHMLRLGYGEAELETEEEYSKIGRVNALLERRLLLLGEVSNLLRSLGVSVDDSLSCERCSYVWKINVLPLWEKFSTLVKEKGQGNDVMDEFPFKEYFSKNPFFHETEASNEWEHAKMCISKLRKMFEELDGLRPFEVLKTQRDRLNYLLTKQARIIAMTCTHAALKRKEFLELGFSFDNMLMEEAAQVLDIETVIPITLQQSDGSSSRLKRVILLGDHHQLPPVIKNEALKAYCKFDQSLFTRLIRLQVPYIELNAQGRARPSIASLYSWQYKNLGNLPHVSEVPVFTISNPGFAFEYQFVDVPDFLGRGESTPMPYFYQNLGEAEYIVLVYQYMRLLGYKSDSISILTTYNGQCALIKDIIAKKCANHPLFGVPADISTVDKFQGKQNDIILLSLVRSKNIGHIRDIRRLIVAMSRARLGLYVFGRAKLFSRCREIQPVMSQLFARPQQLALVVGENMVQEHTRPVNVVPNEALLVHGVDHMADIIRSMEQDWRTSNAAR